MGDSQILVRHVIFSGEVEVLNSQVVVKLVALKFRGPSIRNSNDDRGAVGRAGSCPHKVHPVTGVVEVGVPDSSNLHVLILVNEGFVLSVLKVRCLCWDRRLGKD